jgi:hypothetical protein
VAQAGIGTRSCLLPVRRRSQALPLASASSS